jgi:hypothetical protein
MAECSPQGGYSINWKPGFAPIPWLAEESARQFIAKAVPRHSSFDVEREYNSVRFAKLTATSLERHSNIKLAWTHDLRKHLLLDKEKNPRTLYIYHHIGIPQRIPSRNTPRRVQYTVSLPSTLFLRFLTSR